jgi:phosphatidyl-myo-inositol dimannoside synthase
MSHVLVSNDFLPKVGGIQSYLWELWRRLPADRAAVLTTAFNDRLEQEQFDAAAPMRIIRTNQKWLLPTPKLRRQIIAVAREHGATHVVLDPAFPLGLLGPTLAKAGLTYSVILHGAEVTIPGRLPVTKQMLRKVLRNAAHVISAGGYPLAEAVRCAGGALPATVIPPGVDINRFVPADEEHRSAVRTKMGLPPIGGAPLIVTTSRHVPRKGIDTLIKAAGELSTKYPGLTVAIASHGRQTEKLERLAATARRSSGGALDVRFLGRIDDATLVDLYATADLNATLCRTRWGGLEQEGFGIIFLEAGACGVPSIGGDSGGASEAVQEGITGALVPRPVDVAATIPVLDALLSDRAHLNKLGMAARQAAEMNFDYDELAEALDRTLLALEGLAAPRDAAGGRREQITSLPNGRAVH